MGQAKNRGTLEERIAQAKENNVFELTPGAKIQMELPYQGKTISCKIKQQSDISKIEDGNIHLFLNTPKFLNNKRHIPIAKDLPENCLDYMSVQVNGAEMKKAYAELKKYNAERSIYLGKDQKTGLKDVLYVATKSIVDVKEHIVNGGSGKKDSMGEIITREEFDGDLSCICVYANLAYNTPFIYYVLPKGATRPMNPVERATWDSKQQTKH